MSVTDLCTLTACKAARSFDVPDGGLVCHDLALIDASLQLTVDERFERLVNHVRFIEAGRAALRATR